MRRFFQCCLTVGLMLLAAPVVWSCAICAPADLQNTLSHQLWAAQSVVLARPAHAGQTQTVLAVIKGSVNGPLLALAASAPPTSGRPAEEEATLWLLSAGSRTWRPAGAFPMRRLSWLQGFARTGRAADTSAAEWPARLAFLVQGLEDPHPTVAQAAYEEIAVAPYSAMRSLKPLLVRDTLVRWLATPSLAARRPLYALLLGLVGNEDTARALQAELQRGGVLPAADQSAMLAALIELRGEAALTWIEQYYLSDAGRSDSDLQSVLLALSVHGADGQRITRDRVVATYASWVRLQRPRAGLVASDLAAWGRWEFGPLFAGILQSGESLSFASRYAMVLFLMRSPRPEARQALESLQAAGHL